MSAESPKNPANRKPTVKQARFVEGLAEGKSARRAALDAGYSESSADHATTEILPVVERAFGEVIRSAIPAERLVRPLGIIQRRRRSLPRAAQVFLSLLGDPAA